MDATGFDVLTMGRVGVDLYPLEPGSSLEEVDRFARFLGGSATNVAVAAARHDRSSAVITRTGDDPFGRFIHASLRALGVDDRYVATVPNRATPVAFCEIHPPDDFPLYFYGRAEAPDLEISTDSLDLEAIAAASIFWITVTGLSAEPSRTAHLAALQQRGRTRATVLDLDYRPAVWPSRQTAQDAVADVLPLVTVAIGNRDECETAVGTRDPARAAAALLDAGVEIAVVKLGPEGVVATTAEETVTVAGHPVSVVNGLGAGDGFGGALCHGLLAGWSLDQTIRFANAAGAIVASRLECSSAMPTTDEVMSLLDGTAS
jgi:5-dehydro-2-deoxygluconokinase